jgi:hypothetical protein
MSIQVKNCRAKDPMKCPYHGLVAQMDVYVAAKNTPKFLEIKDKQNKQLAALKDDMVLEKGSPTVVLAGEDVLEKILYDQKVPSDVDITFDIDYNKFVEEGTTIGDFKNKVSRVIVSRIKRMAETAVPENIENKLHDRTPTNWFEGTIGGLRFQVLAFPEESDYGMGKDGSGKVSKLWLQNRVGPETVADYDRGTWSKKPKTGYERAITKRLNEFFNNEFKYLDYDTDPTE